MYVVYAYGKYMLSASVPQEDINRIDQNTQNLDEIMVSCR